MWTDSSKHAPWKDPRWERWREREKELNVAVRYCGDCGFAHKIGNCAPKVDEKK